MKHANTEKKNSPDRKTVTPVVGSTVKRMPSPKQTTPTKPSCRPTVKTVRYNNGCRGGTGTAGRTSSLGPSVSYSGSVAGSSAFGGSVPFIGLNVVGSKSSSGLDIIQPGPRTSRTASGSYVVMVVRSVVFYIGTRMIVWTTSVLSCVVYKTRARGVFVVMSMRLETFVFVVKESDLGKRREREYVPVKMTQMTDDSPKKYKLSVETMVRLHS